MIRFSPIKPSILFLAAGLIMCALSRVCMGTEGAEITRHSTFESVDAFYSALGSLHPSANKSDFSSIFSIPAPGQPELPETGKPVFPTSIESISVLWSDENQALVWAKANPPTEACQSCVGVLFLLTKEKGAWGISDLLTFHALGKYSEISAEQTAYVGTGYQLSGNEIVITIAEKSGGRGEGDTISASFRIKDSKLKRLNLN